MFLARFPGLPIFGSLELGCPESSEGVATEWFSSPTDFASLLCEEVRLWRRASTTARACSKSLTEPRWRSGSAEAGALWTDAPRSVHSVGMRERLPLGKISIRCNLP